MFIGECFGVLAVFPLDLETKQVLTSLVFVDARQTDDIDLVTYKCALGSGYDYCRHNNGFPQPVLYEHKQRNCVVLRPARP